MRVGVNSGTKQAYHLYTLIPPEGSEAKPFRMMMRTPWFDKQVRARRAANKRARATRKRNR